MKRTFMEKLGDFVLGRGFYIVLFLCVATIGITGYFLLNTGSSQGGVAPVTGQPEITIPDPGTAPAVTQPPPAVKPVTPAPKPDSQPKAAQTPAPVTPAAQEPAAPTAAEAPAEQPKLPTVFTWPVKGEVLLGHSLEVLAYDQTMGDWRIHSGADIAAAQGTQVLAVSDGTIQAVFFDDLMGQTVVIDHGAGLISTYANLSPETVVTTGEEVSIGTVIGVVGQTAIAESAIVPHLHIEMSLNDAPVDPVSYFPPK